MGVQVSGVQVAGVQVAGVQVAGFQVAGAQVVRVQVAGLHDVSRRNYNIHRHIDTLVGQIINNELMPMFAKICETLNTARFQYALGFSNPPRGGLVQAWEMVCLENA